MRLTAAPTNVRRAVWEDIISHNRTCSVLRVVGLSRVTMRVMPARSAIPFSASLYFCAEMNGNRASPSVSGVFLDDVLRCLCKWHADSHGAGVLRLMRYILDRAVDDAPLCHCEQVGHSATDVALKDEYVALSLQRGACR